MSSWADTWRVVTWQSEGWLPQHMVARDGGGAVVGVAPLYLKG